jgi:hypothetical protein
MRYSKSLRTIGQCLEILRVEDFELEKEDDSYVVRSESLTPTSQWILRNSLINNVWDSPDPEEKSIRSTGGDGWLRYDPMDISRLDVQGRKKRRGHSSAQIRGASKLSQLLRTLGEHLDRIEVSAFNISWDPDSVAVNYEIRDGHRERRDFSIEKLHQLGLHMRFRRSSREA